MAARIESLRKQARGTVGALALPIDPGALNFGIAGLLAAGAALAIAAVQAAVQRLPHVIP